MARNVDKIKKMWQKAKEEIVLKSVFIYLECNISWKCPCFLLYKPAPSH